MVLFLTVIHKTKSDIQEDENMFQDFLHWLQDNEGKDVSEFKNTSHKELIRLIMGVSKNEKSQHSPNRINADPRPNVIADNNELENWRKLKQKFIDFKVKETEDNENNRKKEDNEHKQREKQLEIGKTGASIDQVNVEIRNQFEIVVNSDNQFEDESFPASDESLFMNGERNVSKFPHR